MTSKTKTKAGAGANIGANVGANIGANAGANADANVGANVGAKIAPRLPGGLAGWVLGRLRGVRRPAARLQVVERITLGPRQTLALVEAEGRRVLVATSSEGAPAFYAIDGGKGMDFERAPAPRRARPSMRAFTRASW